MRGQQKEMSREVFVGLASMMRRSDKRTLRNPNPGNSRWYVGARARQFLALTDDQSTSFSSKSEKSFVSRFRDIQLIIQIFSLSEISIS